MIVLLPPLQFGCLLFLFFVWLLWLGLPILHWIVVVKAGILFLFLILMGKLLVFAHWPTHFECNGHLVSMLTQQHVPPLLTSAVTLSLFTHVHFRPLSLAATLHLCCSTYSCYINNGLTFYAQILCYIHTVESYSAVRRNKKLVCATIWMDESWKYFVNWREPVIERHMCDSIYI